MEDKIYAIMRGVRTGLCALGERVKNAFFKSSRNELLCMAGLTVVGALIWRIPGALCGFLVAALLVSYTKDNTN